MSTTGGCLYGAIRYDTDGAPMVGWSIRRTDHVRLTRGAPKVYQSSTNGRRHFCSEDGTGPFYTNAMVLPGITDIKRGTFDDPDAVPALFHAQIAERIGWMVRAHELPMFDRYPRQSRAA